MREFHRDEPTADDNQAAWLLRQAHDGFIGVIGGAGISNRRRNVGARASRNDDFIASNNIITSFDGFRPNEFCMLVVDSNIRSFITATRSEEHTSELQSRFDIVCRL